MKKILTVLSVAMLPTMAFATPTSTDIEGPAESAVHSAVDAGKIVECDNDDGSCKNREMNYRIYYGPDKKTAFVCVYGYPSEGTVHTGRFAVFKEEDGWKLVKAFQKPYTDFPPPENKDVKFLSASKVKVKYHFMKPSDSNCCATGIATTILDLQ